MQKKLRTGWTAPRPRTQPAWKPRGDPFIIIKVQMSKKLTCSRFGANGLQEISNTVSFQVRLFDLLFTHSTRTKGIPLDDFPEPPTDPTQGPSVLPPVLQTVIEGIGSQSAEPQGAREAETRPGSIPVPQIARSNCGHSADPRSRVRSQLPGDGRWRDRENQQQQRRSQKRRLPVTKFGKEVKNRSSET